MQLLYATSAALFLKFREHFQTPAPAPLPVQLQLVQVAVQAAQAEAHLSSAGRLRAAAEAVETARAEKESPPCGSGDIINGVKKRLLQASAQA